MLLLDVVVCDLATLICVKVQRWDGEQCQTSNYRDGNNAFNSHCCRDRTAETCRPACLVQEMSQIAVLFL